MDERYGKRVHYIDNIKIAACILVVLGHFQTSMVVNGIFPDDMFYSLTNMSLYTFHVPIFFVCSGFLYQKTNRVHSVKSWLDNVWKKLIALGVPYFTFTTVTVLLKHLAKDSVTNEAGGLIETLFVEPIAPYWYLFALFFMFLLIPCFNTKKQAVLFFCFAVLMKLVYFTFPYLGIAAPYIIRQLMGRTIWFAMGVLLAFFDEGKIKKLALPVCIFSFAGASAICVYFYRVYNPSDIVRTSAGFLFIVFIIFLAVSLQNEKISKLSYRLSDYFMPVYVLHTITSSALRIILIKLEIMNPAIHIIAGLIGGFVIPVIIYEISKKLVVFEFFFYPLKTINYFKSKKAKGN